jgi:hypothetical protein
LKTAAIELPTFATTRLQIASGYTKPPSQGSTLAGISQVNLVANGLRLGVTHCVSLDARLIAFVDDFVPLLPYSDR